ncbi:MAG: DUF6691 family protein [Oligoflexales bacterium]
MRYLTEYLSGVLFGLGLGVSGMTNPDYVIGFLDFFGLWKPELIFVMVGAIACHGFAYFFITKRQSPLLFNHFILSTKRAVDLRLIVGSALFGIGWGLAGYCPGPAIVSLVSCSYPAFIFISSMIGGMIVFHYVFKPLALGGKR